MISDRYNASIRSCGAGVHKIYRHQQIAASNLTGINIPWYRQRRRHDKQGNCSVVQSDRYRTRHGEQPATKYRLRTALSEGQYVYVEAIHSIYIILFAYRYTFKTKHLCVVCLLGDGIV